MYNEVLRGFGRDKWRIRKVTIKKENVSVTG
jgi:hypothetical protein